MDDDQIERLLESLDTIARALDYQIEEPRAKNWLQVFCAALQGGRSESEAEELANKWSSE